MENKDFKVIEGGLKGPQERAAGEPVLVDAYITDTRLMGVLGVYAHWYRPTALVGAVGGEHHFLYIDAEDGVVESFCRVDDEDTEEVKFVEGALMNGLGGSKVHLDRRELSILVRHYWELGRSGEGGAPVSEKDVKIYLDYARDADAAEINAVLDRQYTKIDDREQLINYFLMRFFAHDREAAKKLSAEGMELPHFGIPRGVVSKNNIEESGAELQYNCESVLDCADCYYHVVSRVSLESEKAVSGLRIISAMKISPAEAAMILARPEFVSVYGLLGDPEEHEDAFLYLSNGSDAVQHESGVMFVRFFPHNRHVSKRTFRISDDVAGVCYVTDSRQMIFASYTREGVEDMERMLENTTLSKVALLMGRYEFKEPVLYDFIQSGFEYFEEYLEAVKR